MRRKVVVVVAVIVTLAAVAVVADAIGEHNARASTDPSLHPQASATATIVRTDLTATTNANGLAGYAPIPPVLNRIDGTYTWLPASDQVVPQGGVLYAVDDRPVVEMRGSLPAYRPFTVGMADGPDVAQLEAGLVALGDDPAHLMTVDDHFDWATRAAVERWQASLGLPATGTVELGRIVFTSSSVRVGPHLADLGEPAGGGAPYEVTSDHPVVTFPLEADRQGQVPLGATVAVDLLDGNHTTGRISAVDATASGSGSDGSGSSGPSATVTVTVTLSSSPAASAELAGAPVTVSVAVASRHDVLAVPVTALLALAEGGYGIEVVEPHGRRLVGVTTGLFAQSLVEVVGSGLAAGQRVVISQ
jgi:peptidoglycan hydrolase-like protein with peptidoglycan-binding domain